MKICMNRYIRILISFILIILTSCVPQKPLKLVNTEYISSLELIKSDAIVFQKSNKIDEDIYLIVFSNSNNNEICKYDLKGNKINDGCIEIINQKLINDYKQYKNGEYLQTVLLGFFSSFGAVAGVLAIKNNPLIREIDISNDNRYIALSHKSHAGGGIIIGNFILLIDQEENKLVKIFSSTANNNEDGNGLKYRDIYFDENNNLNIIGLAGMNILKYPFVQYSVSQNEIINFAKIPSFNVPIITKIHDGRLYYSADGELYIYSIKDKKLINKYKLFRWGYIWPLEIHQEYIRCKTRGNSAKIFDLSLKTGKIENELYNFEGFDSYEVIEIPGEEQYGLLFETSDYGNNIKLIDYKSEKLSKILEGGSIRNIMCIPDGNQMYVYFIDGDNGIMRLNISDYIN